MIYHFHFLIVTFCRKCIWYLYSHKWPELADYRIQTIGSKCLVSPSAFGHNFSCTLKAYVKLKKIMFYFKHVIAKDGKTKLSLLNCNLLNYCCYKKFTIIEKKQCFFTRRGLAEVSQKTKSPFYQKIEKSVSQPSRSLDTKWVGHESSESFRGVLNNIGTTFGNRYILDQEFLQNSHTYPHFFMHQITPLVPDI